MNDNDDQRRRRSLISARGWRAATTLGTITKMRLNPVRVPPRDKPFQGLTVFFFGNPGLSLRSNPGLKLANACGVNGERLRRIN